MSLAPHQLDRADDLEGRPVHTGRPSRLWVLGCCLLVGCSWLRPAPPELLESPSLDRIERVHRSRRRAESPRDRRLVVGELLASLGVTPLAGGAAPFDQRRYRVGSGDTLVGGLVPGRHPVIRSELVVARMDAADPGVATLLEATRVLVARSKTGNVPGRSLLIAFASDSTRHNIRSLWPGSRVHAWVDLEADEVTGMRYRISRPRSSTDTTFSASGLDTRQQVEFLLQRLLHLTSPADTSRRDTETSSVVE